MVVEWCCDRPPRTHVDECEIVESGQARRVIKYDVAQQAHLCKTYAAAERATSVIRWAHELGQLNLETHVIEADGMLLRLVAKSAHAFGSAILRVVLEQHDEIAAEQTTSIAHLRVELLQFVPRIEDERGEHERELAGAGGDQARRDERGIETLALAS